LSALTLHLSENLCDQIIEAARAAYPLECCGLIEGAAAKGSWYAHAIHHGKNLAEDPETHFLIDPQMHFELLRRLRGSERCIIGCFHSHPNGLSTPSADDRAKAIEVDFVWLIASRDRAGFFGLSAYVFSETAGDFAALRLCP
jgi:proteasome lid subunit RPN8/RPN11